MKSYKNNIWIFLSIVIVYLLIFCYHNYVNNYGALLKFWGVPALSFGDDLKILLCGIDAIRKGQSPYLVSNCESASFQYNYPPAWAIFKYLPFVRVSNYLTIGLVLLGFLFASIFSIFKNITFKNSIYLGLILISPAFLLTIERINNDVIIFPILIFAFWVLDYWLLSDLLILFVACLKFFPIAFFSINAEKLLKIDLKTWIRFLAIIALFVLYIFMNATEIGLASDGTPRPYKTNCFGLLSLPLLINKYLNIGIPLLIGIYVLAISIMIYFITKKFRSGLKNLLTNTETKNGKLFIAGLALFFTIWVIGSHYELRLFFLILLLPYLFNQEKQNGFISKLFLTIIFLVMYQSFYSRGIFLGIFNIPALAQLMHFVNLVVSTLLFAIITSALIVFTANKVDLNIIK